MIDLSESKYERLIQLSEINNFVSDIDIFNYYVPNLSESLKLTNSPFRVDNYPSFGVFWSSRHSMYLFKDFATGQVGDALHLVRIMFNISMPMAAIKICHDLNIPLISKVSGIPYKSNYQLIKKLDKLKTIKKKSDIKIKSRLFNYNDLRFWDGFGVSKKILNIYNVVPISFVIINLYSFKTDDYGYAYIENKDNEYTIKSYQPYSLTNKFMNNNNSSILEGYSQLPDNGKKLIITSSRKDLMSIVSTCGIPAIAPQSENTMIKPSVMDELKSRFDEVMVMYDNDYTNPLNPGRRAAKVLSEKYDIKQIEIPEEYKSKDYSDLVYNHSVTCAKNVLHSLI